MLIDLPTIGETLSPVAMPLPGNHSRHLIANGVKGTAQTIEMMQKLVTSAKRNNDVREVVGKILNPDGCAKPCKPKDYFCYAKKLYEWVRDNILYAYDPHMVEFLEAPRRLLKNKIGDCDSQDMLLCAMFEQIGLQSQFVTIKADANRPDEYTHVYTRVLIPKVGWIVADPIMPEKWFGWEPPYPEGRRYWPASSDDRGGQIDTTPSIPFPHPSNNAPEQPSFDVVNGVSGMGQLGHGGGHGHGGRSRRGWGGGGYGGPGYWGGGFDDNIYILPIAVPMPDQISIIPQQDVQSQEIESPVMEENSGMGMSGVGAWYDAILSPVNAITSTVSAAVGVRPPMDDKSLAAWVTRILDGTEAKNLNDARSKAFTNSDAANKALRDARALSDSNPQKNSTIAAATNLRDAAIALQQSINDAMAKYNEVAALIGGLSHDAYNIPKLSGMGAFPVAVVAAAVASGFVAWAVYSYSTAQAQVSDNLTKVELAKIELAKVSPQAAAAISKSTAGSSYAPSDWGSLFNSASGQVVKSALTLGVIGLAFYAASKVIGYGANVADSKIRQTLKIS